jgi:hypothetical protein
VPVTCEACSGQPPLCATCREQALGWLRSAAATRGERWGRSVAERRPGRRWPAADDPRVRAIARRWVRDLARDLELLEQLVTICAESARAAYERTAPAAGMVFSVRGG